jgi:hypothetical protein
MRRASVSTLFLAFAGICGCVQPDARIDPLTLKNFALSLQQAWPVTARKLQLTMSVEKRNGNDVLHCRLVNVSATTIELDSSDLPWKTTQLFQMAAVNSSGKVIHQSPLINQLMGGPRWEPLAPGASLEGDIEMKYLPFPELPRDHDLLLLWSRNVGIQRNTEYEILSGIAFLPKRS